MMQLTEVQIAFLAAASAFVREVPEDFNISNLAHAFATIVTVVAANSDVPELDVAEALLMAHRCVQISAAVEEAAVETHH